jgi:hypothetical protein
MAPDEAISPGSEYGLPPGPHPDWEIDHLIPLCLGDADSDTNLWPQPRRSLEPEWSAERKDDIEHRVCQMICNGVRDICEERRQRPASSGLRS